MSNHIVEKHISLELWRSETGMLAGSDDPAQFLSCKSDQPKHVFIGREVTYWVYCPTHEISREEALNFCNLHHQGKLRTLHFDLSTLNPPRKQDDKRTRGK